MQSYFMLQHRKAAAWISVSEHVLPVLDSTAGISPRVTSTIKGFFVNG